MTDPAPFYTALASAPPPARVDWLHTSDGVRLRAAFWSGPRGMVAIFPGRTEVIEKYGRVVADLTARGYGAAVIDWRGQGLADRLAGQPLLGDVADFSLYQRDVAAYDAALRAFAPGPRVVLAHSMGGCIALRALMRGFDARAAAFSAPMWGLPVASSLRRVVTVAQRMLRLGRLDLREIPGAGIEFRLWENPFADNDLTNDRATYDWMQSQVNAAPDLRLGAPSLRWLAAALREVTALSLLPSPHLPALCALGGAERVVAPAAIRARMAAWPEGRLIEYPGALHEILMEIPATRDDFMKQTDALYDLALGGA